MINWRVLSGFILGCVAGASLIYCFFPRIETKVAYEQLPPLEVKSETKNQAEYSLVEPEQPGEVTRLVNRDNKVYVVVNSQEYELKGSGTSQVMLGQNGTVQVTQEVQAKVDLTELFNQRLNAELEKERLKWAVEKANLDKPNELELGWSNHGTEVRLKRNFTNTLTGYIGSTTNGEHYGAGFGIRFK